MIINNLKYLKYNERKYNTKIKKKEESLKLFIFYTILFTSIVSIHPADDPAFDMIIDSMNPIRQIIVDTAKTEFNINNNDFQAIQSKIIEYDNIINELFLRNGKIEYFYYDPLCQELGNKVLQIAKTCIAVPRNMVLLIDNSMNLLARSDLIFYNSAWSFLIVFNPRILEKEEKKYVFGSPIVFLASVLRYHFSRIIWCCNGIIEFLLPCLEKKEYPGAVIKETQWFKKYEFWRESSVPCYYNTISPHFAFDDLIILLSRFSLSLKQSSDDFLYKRIKNQLCYCQNMWNLDIEGLLQIYYPGLLALYKNVALCNNRK